MQKCVLVLKKQMHSNITMYIDAACHPQNLKARMNLGTAEEMQTDGFSKPYDPAEHRPFVMFIQEEAG
jgi:hypothetical protein